jgi:hypothetical protein
MVVSVKLYATDVTSLETKSLFWNPLRVGSIRRDSCWHISPVFLSMEPQMKTRHRQAVFQQVPCTREEYHGMALS